MIKSDFCYLFHLLLRLTQFPHLFSIPYPIFCVDVGACPMEVDLCRSKTSPAIGSKNLRNYLCTPLTIRAPLEHSTPHDLLYLFFIMSQSFNIAAANFAAPIVLVALDVEIKTLSSRIQCDNILFLASQKCHGVESQFEFRTNTYEHSSYKLFNPTAQRRMEGIGVLYVSEGNERIVFIKKMRSTNLLPRKLECQNMVIIIGLCSGVPRAWLNIPTVIKCSLFLFKPEHNPIVKAWYLAILYLDGYDINMWWVLWSQALVLQNIRPNSPPRTLHVQSLSYPSCAFYLRQSDCKAQTK